MTDRFFEGAPGPSSQISPVSTSQKDAEKASEKDKAGKRFLTRKSWFTMELQRQQTNRYQMALDECYYDGEQWTPDERAEIMARGQNPVVYNEVAPEIDFLIGLEARTRTDYDIMARNDDSPEADADAEVKSKLMKYIEDINKAPFERSQAIDECFKAGLGWLEAQAVGDPTQMPIRIRSESWRYMLHDSLGHHMLSEDWRYVFRFKDVDFDIADAMFGYKKTDMLRKAVVHYDTRQTSEWLGGTMMGGMMPSFDDGLPRKWNTFDADAWVNNPRERLMLIEAWTTEPYKTPRGKTSSANVDDAIRMRKRVAVMTEFDTLIEEWSPYNHGRYPFIPLWCYRRKKDGQPYSPIRRHRGPQDMLNKQMSKAQFRIAVNQVRMEEGALNDEIMDEEELRDEVASPDGILIFARGALQGNKVEIREGQQFLEGDLKMVAENRNAIRSTSGRTHEDGGANDPGRSASARNAKEEQGGLLTAKLFDNIRMARQIEGEIVLSLSEQYHTQPMTFSVPGEIKKREFVKINQQQADGSVLNDISKRTAQYVIGEQPWNQALSEASFEAAMDMLGSLSKTAPQVVVAILDIVFELNPNLPKKARILQRIRQATGQPDPDKGPTPEQIQQNQQKQQMAQAEFSTQMALMQAKVLEAKAKGESLEASAFMDQLEGLYMAAQAAQIVVAAPQLAPVMDEIAKAAGFVDKDAAGGITPPASMLALQPPQAPPQAPPQQPNPGPAIPPLQGKAGALAGHEFGMRSVTNPGIRPTTATPGAA